MHEVFNIYDSASQSYNNPFYFLSSALAKRSALDLIQEDNAISRHPADFTMFKIGTYDPRTGCFTLFDTPEMFLRFHELAASNSAQREILEKEFQEKQTDIFEKTTQLKEA